MTGFSHVCVRACVRGARLLEGSFDGEIVKKCLWKRHSFCRGVGDWQSIFRCTSCQGRFASLRQRGYEVSNALFCGTLDDLWRLPSVAQNEENAQEVESETALYTSSGYKSYSSSAESLSGHPLIWRLKLAEGLSNSIKRFLFFSVLCEERLSSPSQCRKEQDIHRRDVGNSLIVSQDNHLIVGCSQSFQLPQTAK